MEIGGFLLGAVVASAIAKVLWNKEKAKHNIILSALKEEVDNAGNESVVKEEKPAARAAIKKKASTTPKKKTATASKAKKPATAEDVEGKIKDAVNKLKASDEKISLAAVSRESGISYSRVKREKDLVEKYK
jgi:hypothetical protein